MTLKAILFATATGLMGIVSANSALAADTAPAQAAPAFDIAVQAIIANDSMAYGITNTDHGFYGSININPTYDIYYANIFLENLKYTNVTDASLVTSQLKLQVGLTPTFGPLSIDLNVQRRMKLSSVDRYVTVPFATATYKFNDQLSASLGAGYYIYDTNNFYPNTPEVYGALDVTPVSWLALHGEATYDFVGQYSAFAVGFPGSVPAGTGTNPYLEAVGSVTVTLPHDISVSGKLGFEGYNGNAVLPDYTWFDVGADYALNSHISLGLHYQGSSLGTGSVACGAQAWNLDCDSRILASLTLKGKASDLHK